MKTIKYTVILSLILFTSVNFISCNQRKSKETIQYEINNLNNRIRTLEQEIPTQRQYGNKENVERMEDNLRNYKIQVDELNRQLVK
ncbi:MAG: hypothetical protein IJE43_15195 [Alphaproteobacteria bacterium]|nr:hypothetical protein [Alphaproteobacteria bacterium]